MSLAEENVIFPNLSYKFETKNQHCWCFAQQSVRFNRFWQD